MNWTHVLLAGYVGAVIATVVSLIRKKNWIGRGGAIALTLVAIAIWNIFDIHYLRKSTVQVSTQKLDAALQGFPTYKVIEEQEPQIFSHIRNQILKMTKDGKSEQQIIDVIQPQVLALQRQSLQFAPDDLVVAVMKSNMEQTAAIQSVSDEDCFRFLFPEVKGGINAARILPHEIIMKRINTDVAMMRSAYGENKHTVTDEERLNAQNDLRLVIQKMMLKYGQDLIIIGEPLKGIGKEKIACELVQELWSNVFQLPENRSSGVIRMVME